MAIPAAAAVPAMPTKWPLPMLLAKSDAPICGVHDFINEQGFLTVLDSMKCAEQISKERN